MSGVLTPRTPRRLRHRSLAVRPPEQVIDQRLYNYLKVRPPLHRIQALRLDPATAARRSRAIAGLCHELTATETRYPLLTG